LFLLSLSSIAVIPEGKIYQGNLDKHLLKGNLLEGRRMKQDKLFP